MLSSANITVLNSAAEKTLQQHKTTNKLQCVGCSGNHRYYDKHIKEIVCPNANNPEVKARAAA
eukprot:82375-Ditylum_brightwellii.AAC.1